MIFRVDPSSDLGLADQIAGQVRVALADARIAPGDRLPAAREVANGLDINVHTVLRAYATLRSEGLLDVRRGRGARIRSDADPGLGAFRQQVRQLLDDAHRLGLTRDQIITEIHKVAP